MLLKILIRTERKIKIFILNNVAKLNSQLKFFVNFLKSEKIGKIESKSKLKLIILLQT